jgi:hypothetical protein
MSHLTVSVEYGIHCLLWMVGTEDTPLSTRELKAMRDTLAVRTLADVGQAVMSKAPADFSSEVQSWLGDRTCNHGRKLHASDREVPS